MPERYLHGDIPGRVRAVPLSRVRPFQFTGVITPAPVARREGPPLTEILVPRWPAEDFDVLCVVPPTRSTPRERIVAVARVTVAPCRTSQIHRHNGTDSVLFIADGSGAVLVNQTGFAVRPGARIFIGKGVFHGVHTADEPLTFLSVQSPPIRDAGRGRLDLEPLET